MARTYAIYAIADLDTPNYQDDNVPGNMVLDNNSACARQSNDNTEFISRWEGSEPACLSGMTKLTYNSKTTFTESEVKVDVLTTANWIQTLP